MTNTNNEQVVETVKVQKLPHNKQRICESLKNAAASIAAELGVPEDYGEFRIEDEGDEILVHLVSFKGDAFNPGFVSDFINEVKERENLAVVITVIRQPESAKGIFDI